jgi:subtilase family serine protease
MFRFHRKAKRPAQHRTRPTILRLERCEDRDVPSTLATPDYIQVSQGPSSGRGGSFSPMGSTLPPTSAKTPAQIRGAYGVANLMFGSVVGDGTGQTIAIVDAFNNPSFVTSTDAAFLTSDLHRFDVQFGLADPPIFIKSSQSGSTTSYPTNNSGWGTEIALDVEWSHAMAPGACIVLVEASSNSNANLNTAVDFARNIQSTTFTAFPNLPPVTSVSMSFSGGESSGETSTDFHYTTPSGHTGVTFFASTGDSGSPGGYPATSPNVVAVGGTTLNSNNPATTWVTETGWSGSGGGISTAENKPSYQSAVTQSSTRRTIPDVSMDADPNTGAAVLDSFAQGSTAPWIQVGGTSLSSPLWAGFMALANQGRATLGEASLVGNNTTGPIGTLQKIYSEMSVAGVADYHDITSGNNGLAAGPGYDLVTGVGTPIGAGTIANLMDDAAPTAAATTTNVTTAGTTPNSFTVTYSDNHDVKVSTLNSSDIMLQGPGGSIPVTFVSVTPSGDGSSRTATYQFTPPGGSWDAADNGTYNVVLQANQVSDTAGNFAATATVGSFTVNIVNAPSVLSTVVNDGSAQRSEVTSLTVTFNTVVTFSNNDATAAFTLTRSDNTSVQLTASASVVNNQTVVLINGFGGAASDHGSLADGRYTLKALAANISAGSFQLSGDYTFSQGLFRIFGDSNGDATVDVADLTPLSSTFGLVTGQNGYLPYFDQNGDGTVDVADLNQFTTRFGTVLP